MGTKVEITFGPDGSIQTEVFGEKGPGCQAKTKFLDDLFGEPATTRLKDSFYETDKTTITDGLPSGYCG